MNVHDRRPLFVLVVAGVAAGLVVALWFSSGGATAQVLRQSKEVDTTGGESSSLDDEGSNTDEPAVSDVVIVGAGISGLSAALELGRGGATVTIVDMSSVFGGHAVMSQGGVAVVDTPVQRAAGLKDSPKLAYDDFVKWGEDVDKQWVRYYVDNSRRDIFDWLTQLGVRFESVETAPGNSVDRFHQPAGRGIGLVTPIYRACLEHKSIRFVWNHRVDQLLSKEGRVVGVLARDLRADVDREFKSRAVVLATGGFQSNLEMVRRFWPREFRFPRKILAGSGRNSVGLGHKLAESVGGGLSRMQYQWNYFTGIPDPRYPNTKRGLSAANMYGILVNAEGRRFANLHNWAKEVMPPMLRQKDAAVWFIFDEASKPEFVVSGSDWADFAKVDRLILQNSQLVRKADTLEQLAVKSGLPPAELKKTIDRYNGFVVAGRDLDFNRFGPGKSEYNFKASPVIKQPPFYAMKAYPLTRKSMGGVAIDLECRVLNKDRKVIEALYAVGELTGLAGVNGKAALEGTFLGPCIVTGRVAGRRILKRLSIAPPANRAESDSCLSCHDVPNLLKTPREGFWHFEKSHAVALERHIDCRRCHAELAPYREDDHRIAPQQLTNSCVMCHVAREH